MLCGVLNHRQTEKRLDRIFDALPLYRCAVGFDEAEGAISIGEENLAQLRWQLGAEPVICILQRLRASLGEFKQLRCGGTSLPRGASHGLGHSPDHPEPAPLSPHPVP